jgi:hypothetical protein
MENARQHFGGIQLFNVFRKLCFVLSLFILILLWWLSLLTLVWIPAECLLKSASVSPDTCTKSKVAVAPLLGYAHIMNCLEHQICMLAHLRAFPNLFLDCSDLGLVYIREFFIDSKHVGEQQVTSSFAWRFRDKFWELNICTPRQHTDVFHCEGTPLFPLILVSRDQGKVL